MVSLNTSDFGRFHAYIWWIGSATGVIYVQASKLDEFKSKKKTGEDITVEVDGNFQYGQNKDQTKRFLVYHDKGNKPFQVGVHGPSYTNNVTNTL